MGIRFRRSVNLGGGVRLNLSKSGVGISGGVRGARAGVGSRGTRTAVGIPGTGVYYEKRGSLKGKSKRASAAQKEAATPPRRRIKQGFIASLFIPQPEKKFIKGINLIAENKTTQALQIMQEVIDGDPNFTDAYFCLTLLEKDTGKQLAAVREVLGKRTAFGHYFKKYKAQVGGYLQVTEEIGVYIASDEMGLELLAAELMEENEEIPEAIELLENSLFHEEQIVRLSLGELYFQAKEYAKCIETLQDMENNDELGTTALYYAGLAFREKGLTSAAVDTLRKARRRKKDRNPELLREVRYALAETLEMEGKQAQARKEFEKLAAEDVNFRDALERAKKT